MSLAFYISITFYISIKFLIKSICTLKQNKIIKQVMQQDYAVQISSNTIDSILLKTQDIIRANSLCKDHLSNHSNQQVNQILNEQFITSYNKTNAKPQLNPNLKQEKSIICDNFTPLKLKLDKRKIINEGIRLNFESIQSSKQKNMHKKKSFRKSTATAPRKMQFTASTNTRVGKYQVEQKYHQHFDNANQQQIQKDKISSAIFNKRSMIRTADNSSRRKYHQLEQTINQANALNASIDDDHKRKQININMRKQIVEHEAQEKLKIKRNYHRRSLQLQFQTALLGKNDNFSARKNKQQLQITNYQCQNGSMLINSPLKPFRKTIQNIIRLQYSSNQTERIHKRINQRQLHLSKQRKLINDKSQKFQLMNLHYNNANNRQVSLIPYVSITPGVCLSERSIQASVTRQRPTQINREQYMATLDSKNFRRFAKRDQAQVQFAEPSHCASRSLDKGISKASLLNNQTKDSLRQSILWRPRTSNSFQNNIHMFNTDVAKQMTTIQV